MFCRKGGNFLFCLVRGLLKTLVSEKGEHVKDRDVCNFPLINCILGQSSC